VPEADEKRLALQTIATDLDRLVHQANGHGFPLLAYLLETASAEARDQISTNAVAQLTSTARGQKR
jgi:hypothetical protein